MAFGLDVSDLSIEALKLNKRFGKIKFSSAGRLEILAGIFTNGTVQKKKELAEAIRKVCREAKPHPIRDREVVISLPEARIFSYIFKFPKKLKQKQITDILKFEVPNVLPISVEEVYSDFLVLRTEGEKQEIFYAATPKKIIDDLREVLKMAGLEAVAFDIETASLARALIKKDKKDEGAVIVDIGARDTVIAIFDQSGIRASTTIKVAGNLFTEEIAKRLKMKQEKAEEMKRSCGLSVEDRSCREGKIFLALQSLFPPIISEIKKSIGYYEKQVGRKVKKIILCGGSRAMPGIVDYLRANLNLEVEIGKPYLAGSAAAGAAGAKILSSLIGVFGLAERGTDKDPASSGINLSFDLGGMSEGRHVAGNGGKKFFLSLLAVAALAVGGFLVLEKKEMITDLLFPAEPPTNQEIKKQDALPVSFDIVFSTTGEAGFLGGRIVEIEKSGSNFFPATAKKTVDGQAGGKVKIINNHTADMSLIATTRLLSAEGVLFRLKNGISVPAGSFAETEVYADAEGAVGNIGASQFTLPGLSPIFQKLIYAESATAMTGGTVEKTFVSADDIDQAKTKLLGGFILEVQKDKVENNLQTGELLLPVVLGSEIVEATASPAAGEAAAQFDFKLKAKIKFLAVPEENFQSSLRNLLDKDGLASNYALEEIAYSLVNFDETTGRAVIETSGLAVPAK